MTECSVDYLEVKSVALKDLRMPRDAFAEEAEQSQVCLVSREMAVPVALENRRLGFLERTRRVLAHIHELPMILSGETDGSR